MPTYIEYELDDELTILVEAPESEARGIVKAARDESGNLVVKASLKFGEALDAIKAQAALMQRKLEDLRADEVEVKFGLSTTGEAGNFAIGKVGMEANYEVTLKWKKTGESHTLRRIRQIQERGGARKSSSHT